MILDNKKQQNLILLLIQGGTFTGSSLDEMYKFKDVVTKAEIKEETHGKQEKKG